MNNFFNIIKNYFSLLLEPAVALLIGILSIWVSKKSNVYHASLERLTNAYHPIFLIAEPYLFKNINEDFAKKFIEKYNKIESDYSLYIYPSLRFRVNLLSELVSDNYDQSEANEHWSLICQYLNKDYDNLCKRTHMPLRSTAYRLNKEQFKSKDSLYWGVFKLYIFPLIVFIVYAYLMIAYIMKIAP